MCKQNSRGSVSQQETAALNLLDERANERLRVACHSKLLVPISKSNRDIYKMLGNNSLK